MNTDEQAKEYVAQNQPEGCAGPPCPDCQCHECAVGLAELDIDCSKGEVKVTCKCRDYVCSPRLWQWLSCELLDGFGKATASSKEPMKTFGAMADARVVAGRPVSAMWDIGKALAFSSSQGRKNIEAYVMSRFAPHFARLAQQLQAQDVKDLREVSTRLQERMDDMQNTKLKELEDRINDLNTKMEALPGTKGKK